MTSLGMHWKCSHEARERMKKGQLGKKMPPRSEEHSRKISLAISKRQTGRKRKPFSAEHRKHISLSQIERFKKSPVSQNTKDKIRRWHLAHPNRKYKSTGIEKKMKELLITKDEKFLFQHSIPGVAIVDFFLPEKNLIIECDGCYYHCCEQCGYTDRNDRRAIDATRTKRLRALGYIVQRMWEHDIITM